MVNDTIHDTIHDTQHDNMDVKVYTNGSGMEGKIRAVAILHIPVRATSLNIPKWVSCRLYKKSGSGEMRLMV